MFWKLVLLSFIILFSNSIYPAFGYGHQMKSIASGGPFVAKRKWTQHFAGKFTLTANESKKPMTLVLHNGFGENPGFKWLRVFLCGDIATNLGKFEDPQGDLIFDENYIQKHTISLNITDLVQEGVNTIYVEAIGKKGSVLSYSVFSTISPQLAAINPTKTHQGAKLTLTGKGFSSDASENKVSADGQEFEVVSTSRTRLTFRVPLNMKPGRAILKVTTHGIDSEVLPIEVLPTPKLESMQRLEKREKVYVIGGKNLNGDTEKTEVYLGNFRAKVLDENESSIVFSLPNDLNASGQKVFPVHVIVDGVSAQGQLFYKQ